MSTRPRRMQKKEDPIRAFQKRVTPKYRPNDLERLKNTDLKGTLRKKVKFPKKVART
jgi:hypothetical protein